VSSWPGSVAFMPAMPVYGLILVSLGGLWLCLWQRPWRWGGIVAIGLGLATIWQVPRPEVIASGDGRLFAVKSAQGSMLVSGRARNDFEAETVLRRAGQTASLAWPEDGPSTDGRLRCDRLGCVYRAAGQVVALARDRQALLDDCRIATVVVAIVPVRRGCPSAGIVIDRFALWRHGGYALWFGPQGVRVESVEDWRGVRPWATVKRPSRAAGAPRPVAAARAPNPGAPSVAAPADRAVDELDGKPGERP
jgi:competence protein ComEC